MIPEAAVEAAAKVLGLEMGAPVSWSIYRHLARKTLEAAAPHILEQVERELSDAKRVIALMVSDAGGKVTLSRKSVAELPSDAVIETTQDVINGGWVIRTKAGGSHGND